MFFVQNLYLNQTNVCRVKCRFCAFAVTQKEEGAYTYTGDELVEDALQQRALTRFTEIHMVGGEALTSSSATTSRLSPSSITRCPTCT